MVDNIEAPAADGGGWWRGDASSSSRAQRGTLAADPERGQLPEPPPRSLAPLGMTGARDDVHISSRLLFAHDGAQVMDVTHGHVVPARPREPAAGPRPVEGRVGLPPPELVDAGAVSAAAGRGVPAVEDVHGLRRRDG